MTCFNDDFNVFLTKERRRRYIIIIITTAVIKYKNWKLEMANGSKRKTAIVPAAQYVLTFIHFLV